MPESVRPFAPSKYYARLQPVYCAIRLKYILVRAMHIALHGIARWTIARMRQMLTRDERERSKDKRDKEQEARER